MIPLVFNTFLARTPNEFINTGKTHKKVVQMYNQACLLGLEYFDLKTYRTGGWDFPS